ncbi:MAG: tripartite tricarboxylate transporter TctB family protein [Hyphomicrobiales bacterium]|nr:tripartite tricarboxylate transporter TctB family protein [Hyphomicrobiales bacterium]
MKARPTDLIAASILLAFAIAWSVIVYQTIPATADAIGPRDFPLLLGIILIVLSALYLLNALRSGQAAEGMDEETAENDPEYKDGGKFAIAIFLLIILYGFLIERTGFLLATPIVIILTLAGLLRIRNPMLILALAVGITLGCWVVFNKALGIYMPPGSWISLV